MPRKKAPTLVEVPVFSGPGKPLGSIEYDEDIAFEDGKLKKEIESIREGPMSFEDVEASLKLLGSQAEDYIDTQVSPDRVEALKYYKGGPLGNEEEGRSQVVVSTVRDAVLGMEPALLRGSFGPEPSVWFQPTRPELVEMAEQQSDFISHTFRDAPNALDSAKAFIWNGLCLRNGFAKAWWERYEQSTTYEQTGLTAEQLKLYEQDDAITYTVTKETETDGVTLYDCSVTKKGRGKVVWGAVPPEEVIWSRDARNFTTATLVGHRQDRTVGECVADGFAYDDLIDYAKSGDQIEWSGVNQERQIVPSTEKHDGDTTPDPSLWRVPFYELYVRLDEDGDRIPELRRYYCVGPFKLLKRKGDTSAFWGQPMKQCPIVTWCPYPMPHTVMGQSVADFMRDLQRINTALMRGNIDSLGLALNPRIGVDEDKGNIKDLLNSEIGAILRSRGNPTEVYSEFRHDYVGEKAFPLMQYMHEEAERRTGKKLNAEGIDADALQSSTKQGVMATLSASGAREELMMQLLNENGWRPLFRLLYDLTKQHQDFPRTVRMRGKWVTVDPRLWDDDCEVKVVLGLGSGLAQERLERMQAIIGKQEQILGTLGPANDIVNLNQYTRAVHKAVQIAGDADSENYFSYVTPEQAAQMQQQAAQQPPKEDPAAAAVKMQAEAQMLQAQTAAQRLQLDASQQEFEQQMAVQKQTFEQELAMEKLRQEQALKSAEIEARYAVDVKELEMRAFIQGSQHAQDFTQADEESKQTAMVQLHNAQLDAETKLRIAREKVGGDIIKASMKPEKSDE